MIILILLKRELITAYYATPHWQIIALDKSLKAMSGTSSDSCLLATDATSLTRETESENFWTSLTPIPTLANGVSITVTAQIPTPSKMSRQLRFRLHLRKTWSGSDVSGFDSSSKSLPLRLEYFVRNCPKLHCGKRYQVPPLIHLHRSPSLLPSFLSSSSAGLFPPQIIHAYLSSQQSSSRNVAHIFVSSPDVGSATKFGWSSPS